MPAAAPTGRLLRRGVALLRQEVAVAPRPFAFGVAGAVLYAAAIVGSSWVLGRVVDRVVQPRFHDGHVTSASVVAACAAIVAVGLLKATGIVCRRIGATIARSRATASLRADVTHRYQELPLQWHRSRPTGELVARAGADPEAATEVMAPLPYSLGVCTLLVLSTIWLLATDVVLALVALVVIPAFVWVNAAYQRLVEAPSARAQALVGEVSGVAHESFDAALVVKALGAEEHEQARFAASVDRLRDERVRVEVLHSTFNAALDALPGIAVVVLVVLGAWRVQSGAVTTGTVIAFVNLLALLTLPLRLIGYLLGDMSRSVVAFDRVQEVRHEIVPAGTAEPYEPATGVEVDRLAFSYEEGISVLRGVTFEIAPGSTVAVVGPTGSGKSTLLLVLAGLLRPDAGIVRVPPSTAIAFQDTFLFGDTIRENVLLGLDASDDELREALRIAKADRFVDALPGGVDASIGERGATLSGGQRQRLALARALVRRPSLLLLDEATSSVDPTTEADILASLRARLDSTTTVMVASRPSTIALAEAVLFVDGGRVSAIGTHDDLLARVPAYARLVRAYEQERLAS